MASRKSAGATVEAGAEGNGTKEKAERHATAVALDFSEDATLDTEQLPDTKPGRQSQWKGQLEQLMVATQEGKVAIGADGLPKWVRLSTSPNMNHGSGAIKNIKEKGLYPGGESSADLFELRHNIRTDSDGKRYSEVYARYVGG